jgi:hypothetical protein
MNKLATVEFEYLGEVIDLETVPVLETVSGLADINTQLAGASWESEDEAIVAEWNADERTRRADRSYEELARLLTALA